MDSITTINLVLIALNLGWSFGSIVISRGKGVHGFLGWLGFFIVYWGWMVLS